jgi:hypothetical protein
MPAPAHFPAYDNPLAAGPSVLRPLVAPCGTVRLFDREPLQGWGSPSYASYVPPSAADCGGPWSQVRLDFMGEVAGVQFDRMGAFWIGDAQVLRITTPEPSPDGIRWMLERDLTDYWPLFRAPSTAALQIDNTVDDTYTGVLYISANLTFYPATPSTAPAEEAVVIPLHTGLEGSAWEKSGTKDGQNRSFMLTLPQRNMRLAHVDVYASGHGCEEFWCARSLPRPLALGRGHSPRPRLVGAAGRGSVTLSGTRSPTCWLLRAWRRGLP